MNNLRFTLFFLLGSVALAGALVFLSARENLVATENARGTLCTFAPEAVDTLEVIRRGETNVVSLVRGEQGTWRLRAPYAAPADAEVVARLVDAATVTPLGDMRTEAELVGLREDFADFGLADGGAVRMIVRAGGAEARVGFGARTASGKEVYARVMGLRNVFTLPVDVLDAMPRDADGFRRRALVTCPRDEIAGIDLRAPGAPFVKLVRGGSDSWAMVAPVEASAESSAVASLVDGLVGARIAGFVLPSVTHPVSGPEGRAVKPSALEPYGLGADVGHAVTVRSASGSAEQIVFGARAGTNLVYALVQNGTTVVTLDAALADLCRAGGASFRDTRVFPLAEGERIRSVSFTTGSLVYVLAQGTNGFWRFEAPVVAPADSAAVATMVDRVLRLRSDDVPDAVPDGDAVRVSVTTTVAARPGVTVPKRVFESCAAFADLRSKVLFELDPAAVRRLTVQTKDEPAVAVIRDATRATWLLDATTGAKPATVSAERVNKLLAALTRLEAVGVETVAATPDDYRRCGLDTPHLTVAVDFDAAVPRKNLLLGGVAPGGGRYATAGGADAVFILSRAVVAGLAIPITE